MFQRHEDHHIRVELIGVLERGAIVVALLCLLGVSAQQLLDQPTHAVLAEAGSTPTPTSTRVPATATPSPMSSLTPTPRATRVVSEPTAAPALTATPAPEPRVYRVKRGESLSAIARAHEVSLGELILLNRLENPDLIYVNQELILSDPADNAAASTPSPMPTPADPTSEPSLVSSRGPLEARWIEVDISEQQLTAYEHGRPVRDTLVSTGLPNTPTPVGQFRIWIKFRYDDMAGADYYIEDVPYVMYFHQGYGLHGVTWHANFGHPMSHGCVNLPTEEAEWLFNWAGVGTLVVVRP